MNNYSNLTTELFPFSIPTCPCNLSRFPLTTYNGRNNLPASVLIRISRREKSRTIEIWLLIMDEKFNFFRTSFSTSATPRDRSKPFFLFSRSRSERILWNSDKYSWYRSGSQALLRALSFSTSKSDAAPGGQVFTREALMKIFVSLIIIFLICT